MRRSGFSYFWLFGLFLFFSGISPSQAGNAVRISTIEYPPVFQSERIPGKGYGIALDLTQAAFEAAGITVDFVFIPMIRSVESVTKRRYPANLGTVRWFEQKGEQDAVNVVNLININFMLFYKRTRFSDTAALHSLDDLKGYRIGNVRGSSTTPVVQAAGLNIDWISRLDLNFKKLQAERIDFAIASEAAGWTLIDQLYPDALSEFSVVQEPIYRIPVGVVFHKEEQPLAARFRDGVARIIQNGQYARIVDRYYDSSKITLSLFPDNILRQQPMLLTKP